jgi:acyl dehydratase
MSMHARTFTLDDQREFAALSRDYNPIHVDPVLARRLMYGRPVVHGLNGVLWALSLWANEQVAPMTVVKLSCLFQKPILLDEVVQFTSERGANGEIRLQLHQGGSATTKLRVQAVERGSVHAMRAVSAPVTAHTPLTPAVVDVSSIPSQRGALPLLYDQPAIDALYGAKLLQILGEDVVAELLSLTRLVGMHVPGLHSLFSEIQLSESGGSEAPQGVLEYAVSAFDERFQQVELTIRGPVFSGRLKAFVRPAPVEQATYAALLPLVTASEFSGQRALCVGASRGLGEVCAKLLAAGGASVMLTYHQGAADASRVVDDGCANGADMTACRYDALHPGASVLALIEAFRPTHVYYFATPFIFNGQKGVFSNARFQGFLAYYVEAFHQLVEQTYAMGVRAFWYPSSVAVAEFPAAMSEYTVAKIAGEALCQCLMRMKAGIRIDVPRLPRLATDQTVSILGADNQDTGAMLVYLRAFAGPLAEG